MQFVDEKEWGNILDKISHQHAPLNELASLSVLVTGANQAVAEKDPQTTVYLSYKKTMNTISP